MRRPVVTTWRRRHPDFPAPVSGDASRPLFDARQVTDWLVTTGRADREQIEPDLAVHTLTALGGTLPAGDLVAVVTALICLRYLDDDEPLADGTDDVIAAAKGRAARVDPDDELLLTEIDQLPGDAGWLASAVDELVEAAWGCRGAFERVLGVRTRFNATDLYAQAVAPELAHLVAGLSGTRERARYADPLCVTDPVTGPGDLLAAVAHLLGDDYELMFTGATNDRHLARLVRRRLAVHGVPRTDMDIREGDVLPDEAGDPDAIVTQIPYVPREDRSPGQILDAVDDISVRLGRGSVAVVVGPADVLVGPLPPYSPEERTRAKLLTSDAVEAVVRLPGGLVPFRPGYETALWVMSPAYESRWRGRVLLVDVSDRTLTRDVVDAVVEDVVTWRRDGYDPRRHTRTFAVQAPVSDLVDPAKPLLANRPLGSREAEITATERVGRIARLEADLDRIDAHASAVRKPARSAVAASQKGPPATATIGALARRQRLRLLKGTRLNPADVSEGGHHQVLGSSEVLGRQRRGSRKVDRRVLAERYHRAELTEPGDVIVTTVPELGAIIDEAGYSVVEFPARALRIPDSERGQFTPRVLAALLTGGRHGTRPAGAVRAARRIEDYDVALLGPAEVRRLDELLATLDEHRQRARQEIDAFDELRQVTTAGLTDGSLAFAGDIP
ncbi:MAG: hypothetical protein ACRDN9_03595 [Streptosporangiaceae bacterium]